MTKKSLTEQEFLRLVDASYTEAEAALIRKAYFFAKEKHTGQKRKSGEDYIIHPMAVAEIIIQMGMDVATVEAALLHDVLEDTPCTHDEMKDMFGEEVVFLVEGVTKLAKINFTTKQQSQAENLRKMLLAMCHDLRVVVLKLADRLHNMRTLFNVEPEKQLETAQETLDIYAPLAARLGIMQIKSELEDLCMRYLYPKEYNHLREVIASKKKERDAFVAKMIEQLDAALKETDLKYEINGRSKHFYSIYRKMKRLQCDIDEIYDLVALRVIVDGEPSRCYDVLGIVHNLWKPLIGRFKDYISTPKPNNYQSLHTTVLAPGGAPFEVQIRTREMHRVAEYGVAAHWKYKDGKTDGSLDKKIEWIRKVMEAEADVKDSRELMDTLKADIFSDEVFVFTPKGDVIVLPSGSTIIDFAYAIHSKVGERCSGGKVNQRMVPLSTQLQTGDIVEVFTAGKGPSRDWLKYARSSSTRSRIRAYFKRNMREENIAIGKQMLELECRHRGYNPRDLLVPEWMQTISRRYALQDVDDVYAAIGYGELTGGQVVQKLMAQYREQAAQAAPPVAESETPVNPRFTQVKGSDSAILINGQSGMLVRLGRCCSPVPGDRIVGYISRGRGISVHRVDCVNVQDVEPERLLPAEWANVAAGRFEASLCIRAVDRPQLVGDICAAINAMGSSVALTSLGAGIDKRKGNAVINLTVQVDSKETLQTLKNKFLQVRGVIEVDRKVN